MAGEPPAGSESGTGSISRERLRGNTTTTVTIASGGGATFWTRDSMANGDYSYERKPSSGIVSGPWSARDVVLVGAMGAMAVSTAVLYGAVLARLGEIEGGGRIA